MSGQSGQCLAGFLTGLWHGISSAVELEAAEAAIVSAIDVVIGHAMSAPSIATMPSTADNRW